MTYWSTGRGEMLPHLRMIPRRSGCGQIKLHYLTHNKLHGRCSGRDISADYEMSND